MKVPARNYSRTIQIALIFLAIEAGAIIRFARIGDLSIWYDEGYTAWMVNHSPSEIIRLLKADTAPPLYYLLLHFWTEVFGRSEAGLRSMSATFSVGTLLVAIPLARRFIQNPAGAIAAVWAVALSLPQLEYAQEARFYAMMGFLFAASVYCLTRHLESTHCYWLVPLILLIAASLYTHNMMIPYLVALGIAWLILPSAHRMGHRLLDGAIAALGAGVLFFPWAISALANQVRMVHGNFWVPRPGSADICQTISSLAGIEHMWLRDDLMQRWHIPLDSGNEWATVGIFFIVSSLLVSAIFQFRRWRDISALAILCLFPPLAIAAASYVTTPLFLEKVFLPSAAFLPILVLFPLGFAASWHASPARAFGVATEGTPDLPNNCAPTSTSTGGTPVTQRRTPSLLRKLFWIFAAAYLLAVAMTVYAYERVEQKENWRSAAQFVADLPDHRRLIVFVGSDGQLPFDFYYHYRPDEKPTGAPTGFFDLNPPRAMQQVLQPSDIEGLKSLLINGNYDEAILLLAHGGWADKDDYVWKMLAGILPFEKETDFHDVVVVRFTRQSPTSSKP